MGKIYLPQGMSLEVGEVSRVSDGHHTFAELYRYRLLYNAALFNELAKRPGNPFNVHKSRRHHDGELCFTGGWFIVVAQLPYGQVSNHYEDKDWALFQVPARYRAIEWDGHTPKQAALRLYQWTKWGDQEEAMA
jgi:hypothetical protein